MIFIPVVTGKLQEEGDWDGHLGITPCWDPMPTEPPIGVCNPDVLSRKHFALCEGVRLTVPNKLEDRYLRRLIFNERIFSLETAYKQLGLSYIIPEDTGLHACIRDVLATPRVDTSTGDTVPQYPGNMTCIEFWKCYANLINARRETGETGRIKLGDDAYVPSLAEQECIRKEWLDTGHVAEAYERCGAGDIIPWWENGVTGLNDALRTKINVNIYDVLKASYTFAAMEVIVPTTTVTARATREDIRRGKEMLEAMARERKKTSPWVYGLIAFGIGVVILRR